MAAPSIFPDEHRSFPLHCWSLTCSVQRSWENSLSIHPSFLPISLCLWIHKLSPSHLTLDVIMSHPSAAEILDWVKHTVGSIAQLHTTWLSIPAWKHRIAFFETSDVYSFGKQGFRNFPGWSGKMTVLGGKWRDQVLPWFEQDLSSGTRYHWSAAVTRVMLPESTEKLFCYNEKCSSFAVSRKCEKLFHSAPLLFA